MENVTPRGHASEEELVAHYYGCEEPGAATGDHVAVCVECRASLEALKRDLRVAGELVVPEREAAYEGRVWARLAASEPGLAGRTNAAGAGERTGADERGGADERSREDERSRMDEGSGDGGWRSWFGPRHWALAGALAGLMAIAFVAGRYSNGVAAPEQAAVTGRGNGHQERGAGKAGRERILAAALDAHLADSERILLDVVNTDAASEDWSSQRDRADELVDANRLYRLTAARQGQAALAAVLEDLERVLLELAHAPEQGEAARLTPLRERITDQELVFKLRILQLRLRDQPRRAQGDRKG